MKHNENRIILNADNEFNKLDTNIKVKTTEIEDKKSVLKRLETDITEQNKIAYEMGMNLKNESDIFDRAINSMNNEINQNKLENKDLEYKYSGINDTFNSSKRD